MKSLRLLLIVIFFICTAPVVYAEALAPLTDNDRILILAPHPDDETIGAAGMIQKAKDRNLPVKIVYLTNGDSNELAFIVYEKRIVFKQSGALAMGIMRRDEAIAAMASLGISPENMMFLGYPDGGTLSIFQQTWGVTATPLKSLLTRVRKVPYPFSYSFGAPYVGESILRDLKKILLEYKPTRIFVSHPMDNNPDHRAFYLFLKVALWDLGQRIETPQIYPYLIHEARWPLPRGFHPDLPLTPSDQIKGSEIRWLTADLTPAQVEKKRAAIALYKSQVEYNPPYLFTFARRNELFGDYPPIIITNRPEGQIQWQATEIDHHAGVAPLEDVGRASVVINSLSYARQGKFLYIKVISQTWNDKLLGVNLHLVGYRRGLPFSHMPKYHLKITFSKFVSVFEKNKRVFIKDMNVVRQGNEIIIKFPLDSLENPHYILSSARSYLRNTDIDRTAWRVLVID